MNPESMPKKGIVYALLASILFGLTTPFSKSLLAEIEPTLLAGLFYLGSGFGLLIALFIKSSSDAHSILNRGKDSIFLGLAILCGGILAPVLLMHGLKITPASSGALLLNTEGVFTATIAWLAFKEPCDRKLVAGMIAIVLGGIVLTTGGRWTLSLSIGSLLVICACFFWGLDNNLTRKISSENATRIACLKGLAAGLVNTFLAILSGAKIPEAVYLLSALLIGFLGYGISLVLYVLALRHIGAARTGAYFAVAPFIGAYCGLVFFREPATVQLVAAASLMAIGLWLHLTEHHSHEHVHEFLEHEHQHVHDEHHQHEHSETDPPGEPHIHLHKHEKLIHTHPHFPDIHHDHSH